MRFAFLVLAGSLATSCGGETASKMEAVPPAIARFQVGAASASLDPTGPVYAGGMGLSPPITTIHDPLSVRAFYLSNGDTALAFAVADSQGWFASCQEGADLGITGARIEAAKAISALGGPALTQSQVIVQVSHSHAAPTVEGVWGPVPLDYLQLLRDRTVEALTSAARNAKPAYLEWAAVDASYFNNINTAQYDSYPGWTADGQMTVLRALSSADGSTIMTFVNVPTHPDIVCGACLELLGADFVGLVRDTLEEKLGGVAIVGPATLGRQETPVQALGLEQMQWFSGVVTSVVFEALAEAVWVTDPTLAGVESFCYAEATNMPLLILNWAWVLPPDLRDRIAQEAGKYPINRAVTPPYLEGLKGGTWLTAVRIGGLAYLSMPGEPFPEITLTVARAVKGADAVVSLSKAQDDLGYLYPAWVHPFTDLYESDHGDFNVSTEFGDLVIEDQLRNVAALGFETEPPPSSHLPTDWAQGLRPGLQAMASPMQGTAGTDGTLAVALQAFFEPAVLQGHDISGPVHWTFDDGSSILMPPGVIFMHTFPEGRHEVRLQAADTTGQTASWSFEVRVYPQLETRGGVGLRDDRQ